ncbi:MAG: hypothetical protein ACK4NF_03215 [Planctomycetota bacterium]
MILKKINKELKYNSSTMSIKTLTAIYLCFILTFTLCQVRKRLEILIKKIEKGEMRYLNQALKIISNTKKLKNKFKIVQFFLKKIKTNQFAIHTLKNHIWQNISSDITTFFYDELEKHKICSFTYPLEKFIISYFRNQNLFYLATFNTNNSPLCKNNVRIVDDIKTNITDYKTNTLKSIIVEKKKKYYVVINGEKIFGPYKKVDWIYYDRDYRNYAFLYNNNNRINFNGKEMKIKYTCSYVAGLFNNNIYLVCDSKKYRNGIFIFHNFKKKYLVCSRRNEFPIYFSEDGDSFLYICFNNKTISVYYNEHPIKRYKRENNNLFINSPAYINKKFIYLRMTIKRTSIPLRIIYDIARKKSSLIKANSDIIFLGEDYYYLKTDKKFFYVYKNGKSIYRKKLSAIFMDEHNTLPVGNFPLFNSQGEFYLNKISNSAFYSYLSLNPVKLLIFLDGKISILTSLPGTSLGTVNTGNNSGKTTIFFNGYEPGGKPICYIVGRKKINKKKGYVCLYDDRLDSIIMYRYLETTNEGIIYIPKLKNKIKFWINSDIRGYGISKVDSFFYLLDDGFNRAKILLIPLLKNVTIPILLNPNIFLSHNTSLFYDRTFNPFHSSINKIYLVNTSSGGFIKKIKRIKKFCKYQKKLCKISKL